MKKNIRSLLSLLLALVLTLQLAGGLALADPDISGKETLVFELYRRDPNDADKIIPVSAEQEAELLAGKSYAIELVRDNAEKSTLPLSRAAGSITLNDLLKNDLRIAPPEGFFVEQVYLRGDALESNKPKKLPFGADRESATLTLKAGALAVKDPATGEDRFDKEALSTLSTMDPPIYAVVVVLAPLDAEKPVTVTEALDKDASGTETQAARGSERTAPAAPADSADAKFAGWQLSYGNGASLTLQPGESFKPYADCRLEAQWTQILTITANVPVESGEGFAPNGYSLSGKLAEGDSVANVDLTITSEDGRFYSVPSNARIERDGKDVTDQYALVYVTSEPAVKEEEPAPSEPPVTPAPEKVKITITANEPVTKDGGKTYEHNGATLSGTLNEGDQITGLVIDVVKNEDGSYTAVPKDAVIQNGDADVTANYEITYVASKPVTPPAPEKVKLTITANEPVTKDGGKTYEQNGAVLSSGALNDGDAFGGIVIDVVKNEDGSYTAVPKDAVIKNGDTDVTANYEITYVASKPVTPPAEKIAITIRSKDRTAEYSGKLITAEEYEIVSGALAEGDTIEVKYEGGSTNVTASPVASPISSLVIKDSAGNDVTESKYSVTIDNENAGKVTVTKHSITVTAITGTVETDGTKIIYAKDCKTGNNVFNKGHKVEGLLPGHELRGDFVKGSGKETFTTSIDLNELRVVDTANAELDVTANYDIKTVDGKLTIKVKSQTGVPVAVTTKNQSWSYDGTAHKPDQSQYNISGLLDGDVATVSLQIKQGDSQVESVTNAGTYTIVPVVTIKTKDGAAVAEGKYTVTAINGTLTVKKLDITLEAVSDAKDYDGKALVNDKVKAPSLPSGLKYQVKLNIYDAKGNLIKNGAKDVGTYTKKISEVHILDSNGKDVSENFNITTVDGKLTIRPSSMSNSTNPKTGDDNPDGNLLYIILGVASALLLATIVTFLILQNKKKAAREAQMKDSEEYYEPDEAGEEWQQPEETAKDWDPQIPEDGWKKP
ncbi:MAG: hypothetical protein IJK63_01050 [Oscillospiraceae bacterium]|nr:hypothetical protein [Oscillospiraceae bacterium]